MLYFEMGVNSVSILKFSKNFDFFKGFYTINSARIWCATISGELADILKLLDDFYGLFQETVRSLSLSVIGHCAVKIVYYKLYQRCNF